MFESSHASLVFFFGIFWAAILSSAPDYRLFVDGKNLRRIVIGILVLNIYPLVLLAVLSEVSYFMGDDVSFICSAMMSLSVFSTLFFLRAVVTLTYSKLDYDESEAKVLRKKLKIPGKASYALTLAFIYLLGWPLMAGIIRWVPGFF